MLLVTEVQVGVDRGTGYDSVFRGDFLTPRLLLSGRSIVIEKLEALELENPERMEVEEMDHAQVRQGRSEVRRFHRQVQPPQ